MDYFEALKSAIRRVRDLKITNLNETTENVASSLKLIVEKKLSGELELRILQQLGFVNSEGLTKEGERMYLKLESKGFYTQTEKEKRDKKRVLDFSIDFAVNSYMWEERHRYDIIERPSGWVDSIGIRHFPEDY